MRQLAQLEMRQSRLSTSWSMPTLGARLQSLPQLARRSISFDRGSDFTDGAAVFPNRCGTFGHSGHCVHAAQRFAWVPAPLEHHWRIQL